MKDLDNWTMATVKNGVLCYKGSYLMRQRLVLSVLSGIPIRISHIRLNGDAEVGLRDYEVNLLRLLDKITNGTVVELNEDGTSLFFQPGLLFGGTIQHKCDPKRGIGYYLESLLQLGLFCKEPLVADLYGVTNNNLDPSVDLVKSSMLPTVRRFLLDNEGLEVVIRKRGLAPLGGGEVHFKCPVRSQLRALQFTDGGMVKRIRGTAFALRMAPTVANRLVESTKGICLNFLPDVYINTDQCRGKNAGASAGFGVHLFAETTEGVYYSAERVSNVVALGEDVSVPEDVGVATGQRLLNEIFMGEVCDTTSQSTLILCMALGPADVSKVVIGPLSDCSIAMLRNLREFFEVTFKIEHFSSATTAMDKENSSRNCNDKNKVLLICSGIGYRNISKRTL